MARYTDLDKCAADALALSIRVREYAPLQTYHYLAACCRREPERMAQIVMALAVFVDPSSTTGDLQQLVDDAVEGRLRSASRVSVVGL